MSDITILSSQWTSLGKTTDAINKGIIAFKKQALLRSNPEFEEKIQLDKDELSNAIKNIGEFADALSLLQQSGSEALLLFPNDLIDELQERVIAGEPQFFEKMAAIRTRIQTQDPLDQAQLDLLDRLLAALDHERTELFKKLRTFRG